jgi:hypothetical protein
MAKQPSHFVYYVKRSNKTSGNTKGYWTKVGAAWMHKDGNGLDVVLDFIPVGEPRLVLRQASEKIDPAL